VNDRLVWIDCEMTGLELRTDALIEVAVLVTDFDLQILGDGLDLVLAAPPGKLDGMNEVVSAMHEASGLTDAVRAATTTVAEAQDQVLEYVQKYVPEPRTAPLAGNSIATDRGFLARDMPQLDAYLHYRMVDVSSIKELCRRWYPRVYFAQPDKGMQHRALADIHESIQELRYYRKALFVPQPGPSTDEARALAAEVSAEAGMVPETGVSGTGSG
jgi:oligoribonuclease